MSSTTATTPSTSSRPRFALGSFRFQAPSSNMFVAIVDGVGVLIEGFVYLIGPVLILLALSITYLMTYTFATILLPMLRHKYIEQPFVIYIHCFLVAFLLVNVLFNYALCISTKHKGPIYEQVVRELAQATGFQYPETPEDVLHYRREFEDKMQLRLRRRRERGHADNSNSNGVTHRRGGDSGATTQQQPQQAPVRTWMLLTPYEWAFCSQTKQPKPPRSHFDHVSKTLVLNLDHYCPWMFNAIGYFNYRYFVNFLIFIFASMFYGFLLLYEPFNLTSSIDYKRQWKDQQAIPIAQRTRLQPMLPFREERTLVTLCFMLCTAVGLAVLMLGGFHIYLTLTAQTTIEFHANWQARRRAKQAGQKWKNPYSQGTKRNWQLVYGERHWLLALLPSTRQPEFLPVPVPGHSGRRKDFSKKDEEETVADESGTENDVV